jgi:hypothetical protein
VEFLGPFLSDAKARSPGAVLITIGPTLFLVYKIVTPLLVSLFYFGFRHRQLGFRRFDGRPSLDRTPP